jgi:hypothetical protein
MMLTLTIVSSVVFAVGGTAMTNSAAQQAPIEKPRSEKKQLICKSDPVLGSRTKIKRTCLSREEWRLKAEQANDALNEVSRDR